MNGHEQLACSLLKAYDFAVLKRLGRKKYIFYGEEPQFYSKLFPGSDGKPCNAPWNFSPMLEFFLDDAEKFFESGKSGMLSSGSWQEDGKTDEAVALTASAHSINNDQCIVVRLMHWEYQAKAGILRQARQKLLENRILSQHLDKFKEKSCLDTMTKIFNRSAFLELLDKEFSRLKKLNDSVFSLLMLDIDDFKHVNEHYGKQIGDSVLRCLSNTLSNAVRCEDVIARYGGEEFIVLIPHSTQEQALGIAEKIRQCVASYNNDGVPPVTISIGCTSVQPEDDACSLIARAGKALYKAKNTGKNTVCAC